MDSLVVMPNHLHGIVVIVPPDVDLSAVSDPRGYRLPPSAFGGVDAGDLWEGIDAFLCRGDRPVAPPTNGRATPNGPAPRSLGAFVAGFKAAATKRINSLRETPGCYVWQRNYHDRILRDEKEWYAARQYIKPIHQTESIEMGE